MNLPVDRRTILKGLTFGAGASLLNPILGRLALHAAGTQGVEQKRCVFVVQGNGINTKHFTPVGVKRRPDGRDERPQNDQLIEHSLADKDLHTAIEPLTPFKDKMTLIQGLSGKIAEGGTGGHSTNHGALGCYPGDKVAMSQTIDLALAEALPGIVPHVGLGLMNKPEIIMNYQISASGSGKTVPLVCAPELAFKSLFGSVVGGANRAAFDRRTHLLEFMADDVRRARNALVAEEREKFDQYLEAFEALHLRQGKIERIEKQLKENTPRLDEKFAKPTETNRLEAQFEIAAAALIAGLTNVVTIASGGGGQHYISFPELGIPVDGHHYGHGGGVNGKTFEECFVTVRQYHTKLIADLARRLQSIPEGDGTMLDNTLIVYLSDSGDSHHPGLYEWPVMLLGGWGKRLQIHGRYLQFPCYQAQGHRTMSNLYLTLLEAAGTPREKFGLIDPRLKDIDQRGTISELLL